MVPRKREYRRVVLFHLLGSPSPALSPRGQFSPNPSFPNLPPFRLAGLDWQSCRDTSPHPNRCRQGFCKSCWVVYHRGMGHLCGSTCKRKTGKACQTCRTAGKPTVVQLDANGTPIRPPPAGKYRQATPHEKGAAVDMYFGFCNICWVTLKQAPAFAVFPFGLWRGVFVSLCRGVFALAPHPLQQGQVAIGGNFVAGCVPEHEYPIRRTIR